MHKKKWLIRLTAIGLSAILIASSLVVSSLRVSVKPSGGTVSIQMRVAQAVQSGGTNGFGEPILQEIIPATFSRGRLPIVSVNYQDGVFIDMDGIPDIVYGKAKMKAKAKGQPLASIEADIQADIQSLFEVWVLVSAFPTDDPIRQAIPVLLDNEKIVRKQGQDYLVITLGYFGLHLYNNTMEPGTFITRINSRSCCGISSHCIRASLLNCCLNCRCASYTSPLKGIATLKA